jgi:hypothetical protein
MGGLLAKRSKEWGVGAMLALLALIALVLAPPGYMVSTDSKAPGLVICSGHGPQTLGADGQLRPLKDHGAPGSKFDSPCVFAGHGVGVAPALAIGVARLGFAHFVEPAQHSLSLAPGRGLAAPPPPSQGPPTLDL